MKLNEPPKDKSKIAAGRPSKNLDQPGYTPILIKAFVILELPFKRAAKTPIRLGDCLIRVFAERTCHFVLSCRGSNHEKHTCCSPGNGYIVR